VNTLYIGDSKDKDDDDDDDDDNNNNNTYLLHEAESFLRS
jgi:hypothetical protein